MSIEMKPMASHEIALIGQVDRSETVEGLYLARLSADGVSLTLEYVPQDPPLRIPAWDASAVDRRVERWRPQIEQGGLAIGAFDADRLAAFAILGPTQSDASAELCALIVGAEHRRSGIGSRLMDEVETCASARGVKALFIYSNETQSAVRFYLKRGCRIIGLADKTLVKHLPWDVVFAKRLRNDNGRHADTRQSANA